VQGLANGHIVVIGHQYKQDDLSTCEEMFPKVLGYTSIEEDGLPFME
jgi:hypothetical protein